MPEIRNYKSNSNKSRSAELEEEPVKREIEKADIAPVKVKKRSGFSKFRESIVKEDARTVGSYVMQEMFIPKLIDMIVDMGKGAIEMYFYGKTSDRGSRRSYGSKVSYSSYYDDDRRYRDRVRSRDEYYDYDEVTFSSRDDAEEILNRMWDIVNDPRYGKVCTVADYFDLCDVPGRYTDNKYGWHDLRGAYVRRTGKEYVIELPRPLPID